MNKFNTNSLIKLPILFLATGICMCSPQKGDNTISSIAVDNNDILCVAGSGKDLLASGSTTDYDCYTRFYDSAGVLLDEKLAGNENENDYIRTIAIDSGNNIYFGGRSFNAVASDSSSDWWIAKIPGYSGE